jgi:hypothetical protein
LAKSSNKSLIKIIKKFLEDNKKVWDSKLKFSLWVDKVTTKRSLGVSPFHLVYGFKLPFLLIFPCLWKNSSKTTKENLMIWSGGYNN